MSKNDQSPQIDVSDLLNIERRSVHKQSAELEARILAVTSELAQEAASLPSEPVDSAAAYSSALTKFRKPIIPLAIAASIAAAVYTALPLINSTPQNSYPNSTPIVLNPEENSDPESVIEELEFQEAFLFADEQMFAQL